MMNMTMYADRLGGMKPADGEQFCPMSQAQMSAAEKMVNGRFPDDYRSFLETYGASVFKGESEDNPCVVFRAIEALPAHITRDGFALLFMGPLVMERTPGRANRLFPRPDSLQCDADCR